MENGCGINALLDIDPEWIAATFGIKVLGVKKVASGSTKLSLEDYERFFV